MSGAGFYGAGSAPAGTYAVTTPTGRGRVRPPHALYLDASVMDFPLDENGRYVEVHPVDHEASMRLIPIRDSIGVAKQQGTPWLNLPIADSTTLTARTTELVLDQWQSLITAGDITDVEVFATPRGPSGRLYVKVTYRNTRDPNASLNPYRTVELNG